MVFTRNTEDGILPQTKRGLAKQKYETGLAEINKQRQEWYDNKDAIQSYWNEYQRGGELSEKMRDNLSKENDYIRDNVAVLTSGRQTWKELNDEKEESFKEPKKPKTFGESAKSFASSALSSLGNLAIDAIGGILIEQAITLAWKGIDYLIHRR